MAAVCAHFLFQRIIMTSFKESTECTQRASRGPLAGHNEKPGREAEVIAMSAP